MRMIWLLMMLSVLTLGGCAGHESQRMTQESPRLTYKRLPYVIGVGDQLIVDVWRNNELSRSLLVRPDGFITLPLIGDIIAEGETPEVLAADIAEKLKRVIKNPEVTVTVDSPVSVAYQYRVRVIGQVKQPVSVSFSEGMTVMDLVLSAGGLSDFGAGNRAVLSRLTEEGYKDYPINIQDILNRGDVRTNYLLQPSDIIIVPEKRFWRGEF